MQLIDWADDSLGLRGIAPSRGQSRRAFIHDERLLTMSNERLEAFDISDRDEPVSTSVVDLAQIVNQLATVGDTVVRVGDDWWQSALQVTVSSLDDLLAFEPGVGVELPNINHYDCYAESWLDSLLSGGDNVYFLYNYADWSQAESKEEAKVLTLDVSDPTDPQIAGDTALGFRPSYGRAYVPGMVHNGVASVAVGKSLVFAEHDVEYNDLGFITKSDYTLEVVDFSDPSSPEQASVTMPDSLGSTGLLVSGSLVASSHFEPSPTDPDNVRFYLDRLDVSDPGAPELLDPVNVPGSLLATRRRL